MEILSSVPSWVTLACLVVTNLAVLMCNALVSKRQVRIACLFQLFLFDIVATSLMYSLSDVAPETIPVQAWLLIAFLLILPLIFMRVWLALVSPFLLPLDIRHWRECRHAAQSLVNFVQGANYPYYSCNQGKGDLQKTFDGSIMKRGGGPGIILLRPEQAVAVHTGPELSRVKGGDLVFTWRKERPLKVVDLRSHILTLLDVGAVTRDGIPLKLHLFVICQVDPSGAPPDSTRTYPYNPTNVFKVLREQIVDEEGATAWYAIVGHKAKQAVQDVLCAYTADQLLTASNGRGVMPRDEVRERIVARLKGEMGSSVGLQDSGIKVIAVAMTNIEPDEQAAGQRVANWQAGRRQRDMECEAEGDARATTILGEVRARVLLELIEAVQDGLATMAGGREVTPNDVIALSFINAFEEMLNQQSMSDEPAVADGRSTIETVRRLMLTSARRSGR